MYTIHLMPASFGDAILVEWGPDKNQPYYMLIDGGPYHRFEEVMAALRQKAPRLKVLELLIITHVDIDHIGGIVCLLNSSKLPFGVKEVWFNTKEQLDAILKEDGNDDLMGALQGEYLSFLIKEQKLKQNTLFGGKAVVLPTGSELPKIVLEGGMTLTLLAPDRRALKEMVPVWKDEVIKKIGKQAVQKKLAADKRYEGLPDDLMGADRSESITSLQKKLVDGDTSKANASSIAFLAEYRGLSCLFAGDAPSDWLLPSVRSLLNERGEEKLVIDAWKLAHHGSGGSTLEGLMQMIYARNILVSSDGARYKHPHRVTIAKLLKHRGHELHFYFNYRSQYNLEWESETLQERYGYNTYYPDDENGITVRL